MDKVTRRRFFTLGLGAGATALTGAALASEAANKPLVLTTQRLRQNELFEVYDLDKQAPGINLPGNILGEALYRRFLREKDDDVTVNPFMTGTAIWENVSNARRIIPQDEATHIITGVSLYMPETEVRTGVWVAGDPKVYCLKVKWLDTERGQALKRLVGSMHEHFQLRLSVAAWAEEKDDIWHIHKMEVQGANFWFLPSRPKDDIHRFWWLNKPHSNYWQILRRQQIDRTLLMLGAPVIALHITEADVQLYWNLIVENIDDWHTKKYNKSIFECCPAPEQTIEEGMMGMAMVHEGRQRVKKTQGILNAKKLRHLAWDMIKEGQEHLRNFREKLV